MPPLSFVSSGAGRLDRVGVGATALVLVWLPLGVAMLAPNATKAEALDDFYSTKELDPEYIEIQRKRYRFRHWKWSGIFPFYGGWIDDPHVLATPVAEFSEEVSSKLRATAPARYQGFDINPWFKDETSEVVVAIEVDEEVYSFDLDLSVLKGARYGFINGRGLAPFLREDSLVFLTNLDFTHPVFIEIELPLSATTPAVLHPIGSRGWDSLSGFVEEKCQRSGWNPGVCKKMEAVRKLRQVQDEGL